MNRRSSWDIESRAMKNLEGEVKYVPTLGRSSLLLMKLRMRENLLKAKDWKPPPRPKRVSSAKPDTVNPEDNTEVLNGDGSNTDGSESIVTEQNMGSGSSIDHPKPFTDGTYTQRLNDLLTLSHAPVHNGGDTMDSISNSAEERELNRNHNDVEYDLVKRSPIKLQHLKHSTFKGNSMSALTLPRNSYERTYQPILTSLFSQKGKYKFTTTGASDAEPLNSDPDVTKPTTIAFSSAKLHQSNSPDLLFTSTPSPPSVPMSDSAHKTAITYGTLRKSNTTASVTELFHKSKSKVRNSLRNWKLHSRNSTSEDSAAVPEAPRPELYDAGLVMPENYDDSAQNWLSMSHDSASALFHHKRTPTKSALPVKIPTLAQPLVGPRREISRPQDGTNESIRRQNTYPQDGVIQDASLGQKKRKNTFSQDGTREPGSDKGSAFLLNGVQDQNMASGQKMPQDGARSQRTSLELRATPSLIKRNSSNVFDDVVIPDDITDKTPEQESIEILDSVIKSHSQSRHSTGSFRSIEADAQQQPLGGAEVPGFITHNSKQSKNNSLERNGLKISSPTAEALTISAPTQFSSRRGSKPSVELFIPPPPPIPPSSDQTHSHQVSDLSHTSVTRGMSISDVLAQGYAPGSGSKTDSSVESPRRHGRSINSLNCDSYDGSSTSFTESQDFATSEGEDVDEIVLNNAVIRKTGWLTLKHLLVSKRGKLEKPTRRKWQKYWVNLKGNQLLFYVISDESTPDDASAPDLIVPTEGSLVQAMPEHATKSNVMCMSTMHGSAYLLQATSQHEVESWIQSIHIESATSLAQTRSNNDEGLTRKFIQMTMHQDVERMREEIQKDEKMRKMAELQDSVVSDSKSHRAISDQILKWEENAERNHVHVFRLRCYLASLEALEQPHPQSAIAAACKSSKQILSAFKCFNIATLHSLVASKQLNPSSPRKRSFNLNLKRSGSLSEVVKNGVQADRSPMKTKKNSIFGSLRGFDTWRGGSTTSGSKKKSQPRGSVTGILTAFTSSSSGQSSSKNSDERLRTPSSGKRWPLLPPPSRDYNSSNGHTPDTPSDEEMLDGFDSPGGSLDSLLLAPPDAWCMPVEYESSSIRVAISTNQFVTVTMTEKMTFRQLLEIVCQRKQLDSNNHYLVIGVNDLKVKPDDLVSEVNDRNVKVRKKKQYSIELEKANNGFGFTLLRPKLLCCPLVIKSVTPGGVGEQCGLNSGEEIMVANGELTLDMNDADVNSVLSVENLRLLIQTTNYDPESKLKTWWVESPEQDESISVSSLTSEDREKARMGHLMAVMEEYLRKIVVPPPPVVSKLQPPFIRSQFSISNPKPNVGKRLGSVEDIVNMLVVPPPDVPADMQGDVVATVLPPPPGEYPEKKKVGADRQMAEEQCNALINKLLQKAELVTKMCRQLRSLSVPSLPPSGSTGEFTSANDLQHQLSDLEKIWKVIEELVDTENNYVKDLDCLLKRFLEPLHSEGLLSNPEMELLLHSVEHILSFQKIFLLDLSEAMPNGRSAVDVSLLNRSLMLITSAFLHHAAQFKLYAVFSTYHTVAQDLIEQTKSTSSEVRAFLDARNPKQQHSLSLDSYLIKPIQRVLKYPLLLRELLTLSESLEVVDTKSRRRLKAALHAMHGVARHINDSQTVHDEFGNDRFRHAMENAVMKSFGDTEIASSLTLTNLLCYCATEWQNAPEDVTSRIKKGFTLEMLVLVFRSAVVLLSRPMKQREKKKAGTPQMEMLPSYGHATIQDFVFTDVLLASQLAVAAKFPEVRTVLELSSNLETDSRSYKLMCNSVESKQRIVKTVRYIVRDSVKVENGTCSNHGSRELDPLAKELSMDGGPTSSSDSLLDVTPRSPATPSTPRSKKQNFFYLPNEEEPERTSPAPSGDEKTHIPMTLPLPTYEAAVESIVQSTRSIGKSSERLDLHVDLRSSSSTPTRSKSNHRRSGLFITTPPFSQNFTDLRPFSGRPSFVNVDNNHHGYEESSNHGDSDTSHKYRKSPARYNMIYGVAPYESKL